MQSDPHGPAAFFSRSKLESSADTGKSSADPMKTKGGRTGRGIALASLLAALLILPACDVFDTSCSQTDLGCSPAAALLYRPCTPRLLGGQLQGCPLNLSAVVTTLAGNGVGGFADGAGAVAQFDGPVGVTTDGTSLFVADRDNSRIRRIDIATAVVTTLAGSGVAAFANGTGAAAQFNFPGGVTTDGTSLFVADTNNQRIRRIDIATAVVTTLAGSGVAGTADGAGAAAQFNFPLGVTTDGTSLFVADRDNHRIRRIDIATAVVTTLAGSGAPAFADATGAAAQFNFPIGVTTDGTTLFVADRDNHRIRRIDIATAVVTTLAGSGAPAFADATGAAAQFNSPVGVATDGTSLFVADADNSRIRQIDIATAVVTTVAGSGAFGFADGTGAAAQFNSPIGVTTDGTSLLVADTDNHRIRRIIR